MIIIALAIGGIIVFKDHHLFAASTEPYIQKLHVQDIASAEIYNAKPPTIEIPLQSNTVAKIVEWLSKAKYEGVSRSVYETGGWGPLVVKRK